MAAGTSRHLICTSLHPENRNPNAFSLLSHDGRCPDSYIVITRDTVAWQVLLKKLALERLCARLGVSMYHWGSAWTPPLKNSICSCSEPHWCKISTAFSVACHAGIAHPMVPRPWVRWLASVGIKHSSFVVTTSAVTSKCKVLH